MAFAAVLGVLAALGLQPVGAWPATVVALSVLPLLMGAAGTDRQAGWTGWAFGTAYFAYGLMWIVEPFLVDVQKHGWMAPFALVFMSAGLALFWALAFWAARKLGQTPKQRMLALIGTLTAAEFMRTYVLTGFPWNLLAQIWVDTDAALLLAWIGPIGLTFLTLSACIPLGLVMIPTSRPFTALGAIVPALGLIGLVSALEGEVHEPEFTDTKVRLVQPNAPQHQKWDPRHVPGFFQRKLSYTAQEPRPDLVIWPETAVTNWLHNSEPTLEVIADAAGGADVVLGLLRWDDLGRYNTLIHMDGQGELRGTYDKHHLVPFGEYIPARNIASALGLAGLAAQMGGYSPGHGPKVMDFGKAGKAVPLICYEAVFPQDVNAAPERATFLLQITNDAWFGKHSGPYQHLAQARMRAIEQGLPMVRAANTGISAMIDPWGRILQSIPLGRAGYVDALLPEPLPVTIYAQTGDWPILFVLVAIFLSLWGYNAMTKGRMTD